MRTTGVRGSIAINDLIGGLPELSVMARIGARVSGQLPALILYLVHSLTGFSFVVFHQGTILEALISTQLLSDLVSKQVSLDLPS